MPFARMECYNRSVKATVTGVPVLKKIIVPPIVCLIAALLLLAVNAGQAQDEPTKYFPETGHYVGEPFLSALPESGDTRVLGPPITEAFEENGRLVQYFERARLDCFEQAQGPCEVQPSPLGEMLGYSTPRAPSVPDSMIRDELCRYFAETGHNVCFSFLGFFADNGGAEVLGPPISELVVGTDTISQNFRQARIEWHTDAPATEALQLGALGREYFAARGMEPSLLAAVESPGTPGPAPAVIFVGTWVRVVDTEGVGLRMRDGPGLDYTTVETLQDGDILEVIEGPQLADGFVWWRLRSGEVAGWCASDWLVPTEPQSGA